MKTGHSRKVLVAMSGGVDSSVAAALLLRQGYEVVGCFMRLGGETEGDAFEQGHCDSQGPSSESRGCCSVSDASDARLVAAVLGIPLYVLNFKRDFDRVIRYFVDEYNAGRTPNPCVRCNDWLKFDRLSAYARSIDASHVATGHYAQVEHRAGAVRLLRGCDERKDQSYFLFGIKRSSLERTMFPVGALEKPEVRQIARRMGIPVHDKRDSQEICFVAGNDYTQLIKKRTPDRVAVGSVLDRGGAVIGSHGGQQGFTIGQRRGVSVSLGYPVYVTHKDPVANTITVGTADDLWATGLAADQANWLTDAPPDGDTRCQVKIRHNSQAVPATVCAVDPDRLQVQFDHPQRAVTPGQAVVCYRGRQVIGGGWIARVWPRQR